MRQVPRLRPLQAEALQAIEQHHGAVLALPVGTGKTLAAGLAPGRVGGLERPILIVPSALVDATQEELDKWVGVHPHLQVVGYGMLSTPTGRAQLEALAPDMVIADEAHYLLGKSARSRRLFEYLADHPVPFVGMSGTLHNHDLHALRWLAAAALGDQSPIPESWPLRDQLEGVLHRNEFQTRRVREFLAPFPGANVSQRWGAYLRQSPGWVAPLEDPNSCPASINAGVWEPPAVCVREIADLDAYWRTPDGEYLEDPLAFWRVRRTLAAGFYYRYKPPGPVPGYVEARNAWSRAVSHVTRKSSTYDTELLVRRAVQDGRLSSPELNKAWGAWYRFSALPPYKREPVWVSMDYVQAVLDLVRAHAPVLVFTESIALHDMLALYLPEGPPTDPGSSYVLSRRRYGTGHNLQAWNKMLFAEVPASALAMEQIIGRLHRPGQLADSVELYLPDTGDLLSHTLDAWVAQDEQARDESGLSSKLEKTFFYTLDT